MQVKVMHCRNGRNISFISRHFDYITLFVLYYTTSGEGYNI